MHIRLFIASGLLLFGACSTPDQNTQETVVEETPSNLFELVPGEQSGIQFQNTITENDEINFLEWDAVYYGGGVAVADFNNDGINDLFFCGNQVDDALYIGKGDLTFHDASETSGILNAPGWSNGVSVVDINSDGWLDIYVCRSGWLSDDQMVDQRRNKLFINQGDLTFVEAATQYGLDNEGYSTQATWFDYDRDGDVDMFLLNAPSNNLKQKVAYNSKGFPEYIEDKFYRNNGDGTFSEIGKSIGVNGVSFGLGVIAADLNHDNWPDLYVANDYDRPDYLYINKKDGTFENQLNQKVKHTCFTAMGVDAADINNDALIDLAVLDMQSEDHYRSKTNMPSMSSQRFWDLVDKGYNYQYMSNVLQLNNGYGFFSDISQLAGIASTDWSWAVLTADYDLDGFKDIYVTNGINKDIRNNDFSLEFERRMANNEAIDLFEFSQETPSNRIPNYMFRNNGDLTFEKVRDEWGLETPSFSYGAAYGDLDNDGDLDLVVNNNNMEPFVYRNNASDRANWLKVELKTQGLDQALNAKAILFRDGQKQYTELTRTRGYQSSCEPVMHFGMGSADYADSLLVIFPDGTSWKSKNVKANQTVTADISQGRNMPFNVYGTINPPFREVTDQMALTFAHVENEFDDFREEILLPHRQSRNGPYTSSTILEDGSALMFVGGAAGQSGQMYRVKADGSLLMVAGPWSADAQKEDMGSAFFDLEGDGDMDLYIASGGGHLAEGDAGYTDRLYVNQGDGRYVVSGQHPGLSSSASCVVAGDLDGDGDADLFIGGRELSGQYPLPGYSALLINENGVLVDRTQEWNDQLSDIGMVTDAAIEDVNGDGKMDLLIVGEWMAPSLFIQQDGRLLPSDQDFGDLKGWWFGITPNDIDGDGDMDFVLGNIGENNKFHPKHDKPLKVYSADFDGNQTNDIVLAKNSKGTYVPVRGRECSSQQMPFVAEKFSDYEGFATASLDEIYGESLDGAYYREVNEFSSGILYNNGGQLEFQFLPNAVQIAPIMDCVVDDFNGDGIKDLLVAGNHFDAEVETTRHDAGNGCLLLGSNKGFVPQNVLYSGFYAPFNTKDLELIQVGGMNYVFVATNNNRMTVFACKAGM